MTTVKILVATKTTATTTNKKNNTKKRQQQVRLVWFKRACKDAHFLRTRFYEISMTFFLFDVNILARQS